MQIDTLNVKLLRFLSLLFTAPAGAQIRGSWPGLGEWYLSRHARECFCVAKI